ncbi:putative RNA-directed DNA polymerase [Tanacetum coccineum]
MTSSSSIWCGLLLLLQDSVVHVNDKVRRLVKLHQSFRICLRYGCWSGGKLIQKLCQKGVYKESFSKHVAWIEGKLIQLMHTTMVPVQVKTLKIQAGVQVSRPEYAEDIFSIGRTLEDVIFVVLVLVRNFVKQIILHSLITKRLKDLMMMEGIRQLWMKKDVQTPGLRRSSSYYGLNSVNICFASTLNKFIEPTCYSDALKDPNWVDAMNNEIEALNINNTWVICDLPIGRKPIGCKWIYKIKYKASGEIEIYKARLVAKGFWKTEGFDYDETFSPVVKMLTLRCLISIDVVNSWHLYHLDVNNAFLYGDLVEDVYMSLPQGKSQGSGMPNLPMLWLSMALSRVNLITLSILSKNGAMFIALLIYVDDIVITSNDESGIKDFEEFFSTKFLIKDLGILKYFMGIEILENENVLSMTQRKYCLELLYEYGLLAVRPVDIPLPEKNVLCFEESENDKYLNDFTSYQKLIEKLIYLTNTRPILVMQCIVLVNICIVLCSLILRLH